MKNIIEYLKDKIYYVIGITILVIVILILVSSCSSGSASYTDIEDEMKEAAENYYSERKNKLPKENGGTVKVTLSTLEEAELIEEVYDIDDPEKKCTGHVEVTKVGKEYSYTPFLICEGSYEPEYLTNKIKKLKQDEYGNGVYEIDGSYVYKGNKVKNYVEFNDSLWRIVNVDENGITSIVKNTPLEEDFTWDDAYNSSVQEQVGITTNYLNTTIRDSLKKYYNDTFNKNQKARLVSKDLCVGKYYVNEEDYESIGEKIDRQKECSTIQQKEKIGLLTVSDFALASRDSGCTNIFSKECNNYNYLSNNDFETWTLTSVTNNSHDVFFISRSIDYAEAVDIKLVAPVVYLNDKIIVTDGNGTKSNPYKIR